MPKTPHQRDHRDEPMYWFAVLEIAREQDNSAKAIDAEAQLKRLGVRVTYAQPETPAREAAHAK